MNSLKLFADMPLGVFQVLWIFWPVWMILGLLFVARLSVKRYKAHRLSKSGIAELDKLAGEDFEIYLELLFRQLGYEKTGSPVL